MAGFWAFIGWGLAILQFGLIIGFTIGIFKGKAKQLIDKEISEELND